MKALLFDLNISKKGAFLSVMSNLDLPNFQGRLHFRGSYIAANARHHLLLKVVCNLSNLHQVKIICI